MLNNRLYWSPKSLLSIVFKTLFNFWSYMSGYMTIQILKKDLKSLYHQKLYNYSKYKLKCFLTKDPSGTSSLENIIIIKYTVSLFITLTIVSVC